MSRVLVTDGPGLVGSSAIRRLVAAGRTVRTTSESSARAVVLGATLEPRGVQRVPAGRSARRDVTTTRVRLDIVAGSEFLDDRIRLPE